MSTIGILGTGSMARELGLGWSRAGHTVLLGSRTPDSTAAELSDLGLSVGSYESAIEAAEIVVLAIPFPAVVPLVENHRNALVGKTIIDISNPFDSLANNELAAVEYTASAMGSSSGIVAAFKDNFAATVNASRPADGARIDVKIAGDDAAAKAIVRTLAEDLDHRVLDCGPLANARYLDGMVSLMLILDREHADFTMKTGWKFFGLPNK
jgi:predicted dinucleotide-binding enzyme